MTLFYTSWRILLDYEWKSPSPGSWCSCGTNSNVQFCGSLFYDGFHLESTKGIISHWGLKGFFLKIHTVE